MKFQAGISVLAGAATAATFAITGADTDGQIHPRLEISDMHRNHPDTWNLYLLALNRLQGMDQDEMLSYYQVAGIHGVPNVPWDGVQGDQAAIQGGAVGYCKHQSNLFPVWHRAYMTLYEQLLADQVMQLVQFFPENERSRWQQAASSFRVPYWDWAAVPEPGTQSVPDILAKQHYVQVQSPAGPLTLLNPLYRYDFHPLDKDAFLMAPYNEWKDTKRWPDSGKAGATSQDSLFQASFGQNAPSLRDSVYSLFTHCSKWNSFASSAAGEADSDCHTSIESIHNTVHTDVGGQGKGVGDMTYLWWAAMDPIFYSHHLNVDRLTAIWQALNPGSTIESAKALGSSFVAQPGQMTDANTPLAPFHSDTTGTMHTFNSVADVEKLKYTYPELIAAKGDVKNLRAVVKKMYGPDAVPASLALSSINGGNLLPSMANQTSSTTHASVSSIITSSVSASSTASITVPKNGSASIIPSTTTSFSSSSPDVSPLEPSDLLGDMLPTGLIPSLQSLLPTYLFPTGSPNNMPTALPSGVLSHVLPSATPSPSKLPEGEDSRINDYSVNIVAPSSFGQGSWSLYIFLDEPKSEDPSEYLFDPHFVGSQGFFSQIGTNHHMINRGAGQISLTRTLSKLFHSGELSSLGPEQVIPFLSKRLHWRVVAANSKEPVNPANIDGLQVSVSFGQYSANIDEDDFPQFTHYVSMQEATHGKPGGLQHGETVAYLKEKASHLGIDLNPEDFACPAPNVVTVYETVYA